MYVPCSLHHIALRVRYCHQPESEFCLVQRYEAMFEKVLQVNATGSTLNCLRLRWRHPGFNMYFETRKKSALVPFGSNCGVLKLSGKNRFFFNCILIALYQNHWSRPQ